MLNLEKTYNTKFFQRRHNLTWRTQLLCPVIMKHLNPQSIIDVGCGIGDFVKWFLDRRINAWGLEGSTQVMGCLTIPTDRMFFADLRKVMRHYNYFDLAISLEVAEHIEEEYADIFVYNMTSFSDRILISAAGPGQGGHGHVNLQSQEYWREKFEAKGYVGHLDIEDNILADLVKYKKNRWFSAIIKNLMYFEKE